MVPPTVVTKNCFEKKNFYTRYDFLLDNFLHGSILDIGNIGGIFGQGKSDSAYLEFQKDVKSKSILYGFDLFPPKDPSQYPNQKQGNIEEGLPYEDNFFNTIYMGQILEHLSNPGNALKEVHRVLKNEGVLILDVPNPYSLLRILRFLISKREDLGNETHLIFWTPASLKATLNKCGFEIIKINTKLSNKFKWIPKSLVRGLGPHLLVSAKKII